MERNLLFISKYPEVKQEFRRMLLEKNIQADAADNGNDAARLLKHNKYQIVVTGTTLDGFNGDKIITYVNQKYPDAICMIYTGAINAVQLSFYLNKRDVFRVFLRPVDFKEEFEPALEEAYEYYDLKRHNRESEQEKLKELQENRKIVSDLHNLLRQQENGWKEFEQFSKLLLAFTVKKYGTAWTQEHKKEQFYKECKALHEICSSPNEEVLKKVQSYAEKVLQ